MRYIFMALLLAGCTVTPPKPSTPLPEKPKRLLVISELQLPEIVSRRALSIVRKPPQVPSIVCGWDPVYSATEYSLSWGTNSGSSIGQVTTTNTSAAITNPVFGVRYFFCVKGWNAYGFSFCSPEISTTYGLATWAITANSAVGTNSRQEFVWTTNVWVTNDLQQAYFRLAAVSNKVALQRSLKIQPVWSTIFTSTNVWATNRSYTLQIEKRFAN